MRRLMYLVIAGLAPALAIACSSFNTSAPLDGGGGASDAHHASDSPAPSDAGHPIDAVVTSHDAGMEAGRRDATMDGTLHDAGTDAAQPEAAMESGPHDAGVDASLADGSISPLLSLPSLDAATCSPVGNIVVCSLGGCLIAGPGTMGRCQSCSRQGGDCGGHKGATCATAEDCDIGWACYAGTCTLMCPLDAGVLCGFPAVCVNVGNATEGVCEE